MKHFTGREMQSVDWRALVKDEETVKQRMEKQYAEWLGKTLWEMCAAIVKGNPDATEFFFYDGYDVANSVFTITHSVPDENGIHKVPKGVSTVTRVDLVGYKKLVKEGVIKTNI